MNKTVSKYSIYLDKLRREKGLSKDQFARCLSVSPGSIRAWISGEREPSRYMKARIMLWENGSDLSKSDDVGDFARFVLKTRVRYKITQSELAHALDISNNAVNKWELGLAKPTAFNMEVFLNWLEERQRESKSNIKEEIVDEVKTEKKVYRTKARKELLKLKNKKVDLPKLENLFEDMGNQKAPWEYPEGHPKRRRYDDLRNSNKA